MHACVHLPRFCRRRHHRSPQRKVLRHRYVRSAGCREPQPRPHPVHVARVCARVRAHRAAGRRARMPAACSCVPLFSSLRPPPAFLPRRLPVTSRRGNVRCSGMEEHVRSGPRGGPEPSRGRHGVAASRVHQHPCMPIYSGPKETGRTNAELISPLCRAVLPSRRVTDDRRNRSIAG